jgi:excisionase family DNA binding protein
MKRKAYYSPEEVASHFGVNAETIRKMCKEGKIPGVRRIGKLWRVPAEFLDRPLELERSPETDEAHDAGP